MSLNRQRAGGPTMVLLAVALWVAGAGSQTVRAQDADGDVAFVAMGAHAGPVGDALAGLVPAATPARSVAAGEANPDFAFVIAIETDAGLVHVYRRADDARFERRFEAEADDSYALALVAAELLEVARSGADPIALGLSSTVAFPAESAAGGADARGEDGAAGQDGARDPSADPADGDVDGTPDGARGTTPGPTPDDPASTRDAEAGPTLSVGAGVEAWTGVEAESPWLVQPALFVDALFRLGPAVLVGGGVYASGLGSYDATTTRAALSYRRFDAGARVTAAIDPAWRGPRLLGHLRLGASAVVADARTIGGMNEEARRETVGSWFLGLGLEARQAIVAGLEVYLEVSVDGLPAPATFVAFGETLVQEGPIRVAGRLGLGWRFE